MTDTRLPRRPLITVIADILALPAGIALGIYLSRVLEPRAFGLYVLGTGTALWIEIAILSLLEGATVKCVAQDNRDWERVAASALRIAACLGCAGGLLLAGTAGPLSRILGEPPVADCLRVFALDVPLVVLAGTYGAILVGRAMLEARAGAIAARWVGRVTLAVWLVQSGFGVQGAALGMVGGALLETIVAGVFSGASLRGAEWPTTVRVLTLAAPWCAIVSAVGLAEIMGLYAGPIMGGSAQEAGWYGAARTCARVPLVLLALMPVLAASLIRLRTDERTHQAKALAGGAMRVALFSLPLSAVVTGAAAEIVHLLYGASYDGAAPMLASLIFASAGVIIAFTAFVALQAADREPVAVVVSAALPLLAVAGHLIMVPRFGGAGAAVVTAGCLLVGAFAGIVSACRVIQIPLPAATLTRAIIVAIAVGCAAAWWPTPSWVVIIKVTILALAAAAACALWVDPAALRDSVGTPREQDRAEQTQEPHGPDMIGVQHVHAVSSDQVLASQEKR